LFESKGLRITTTGPTGHGSRFIENTAVEKLVRNVSVINFKMNIVNKALSFRKEQFDKLQRGIHECGMKLGDVTTLNVTALRVRDCIAFNNL
jgi:aminoacylase